MKAKEITLITWALSFALAGCHAEVSPTNDGVSQPTSSGDSSQQELSTESYAPEGDQEESADQQGLKSTDESYTESKASTGTDESKIERDEASSSHESGQLEGRTQHQDQASRETENESSQDEDANQLGFSDFKGYYAHFIGDAFNSPVDASLFIEDAYFGMGYPGSDLIFLANIQSFTVNGQELSLTGVEQVFDESGAEVQETRLYEKTLALDHYEGTKFIMDMEDNRIYHFITDDSANFEQEMLNYVE